MKIAVLDAGTLGFPEDVWSGFAGIGELVLHEHTPHESDATIERLAGVDAVFTNKVPMPADVIDACPSLRFIGVLATGYNIIDVAAASAAGVAVCNVPGYSTAGTAQHAVALIIELCNQVGAHSASVHAGDWVRSRHFSYWKQAPLELEAMTVGIIGFGSIGRRVAAALNAMGARVMAFARTPRDEPDYEGFEWADVETIFKKADLVSLHCPETPENSGFVNAALLAEMKPGALFVNTARGGLVNEADLAAALKSGKIGGAAVDVVRKEPMAEDCPLLGLENCLITPHIAWASEVARRRLIKMSLENFDSFLAGQTMNRVDLT